MTETEAEAEVAAVDVVVKIHMERASQKSHYRTCQIEHSVVVVAVAAAVECPETCRCYCQTPASLSDNRYKRKNETGSCEAHTAVPCMNYTWRSVQIFVGRPVLR